MKITLVLLAVILFIGMVSSTRVIMGTFSDDKCTTPIAGGDAESVDIKSGECYASMKFTNKGDKLEYWYVVLKTFYYFFFSFSHVIF